MTEALHGCDNTNCLKTCIQALLLELGCKVNYISDKFFSLGRPALIKYTNTTHIQNTLPAY